MVDKLLSGGAYANVIDSHGRTPLHDVLAWARLDREEEVILTLSHLAKFGADPDATASRQTPRQLLETHSSMLVRDMFLTLRKRAQIRHTRRNLSTRNLNLPKDVQADVGVVWHNVEYLTLHDPGSSDISRSRRDADGSKLPQDPFPHLAHLGKELIETKITAPTDRMDSMLEKYGWALVKGFEASTNTSDQDDAKVVVHERFPELIAEANLNLTHTVASAAGIWSETKTAQLETQAPPPNHASRLQKPAKAFPTLSKSSRISTKAVILGMLNAEAAHFWGGFTERIGSAVEESVLDSSGNAEELRAEVVGANTGRDRKKRRWTPLRF